jgi:hypothetical protein
MKLFEIIIHSVFVFLSIICLINTFIYTKYSSIFFFTGLIIICTSSIILLSCERLRSKQPKTKTL